jgi:hypothetical protein
MLEYTMSHRCPVALHFRLLNEVRNTTCMVILIHRIKKNSLIANVLSTFADGNLGADAIYVTVVDFILLQFLSY